MGSDASIRKRGGRVRESKGAKCGSPASELWPRAAWGNGGLPPGHWGLRPEPSFLSPRITPSAKTPGALGSK